MWSLRYLGTALQNVHLRESSAIPTSEGLPANRPARAAGLPSYSAALTMRHSAVDATLVLTAFVGVASVLKYLKVLPGRRCDPNMKKYVRQRIYHL